MKLVSEIILQVACILILLSYPMIYVFTGEQFDFFYASATSAGCGLLFVYIAIIRKDWGVIPVAVLMCCISLYFLIDNTKIIDDFVKSKIGVIVTVIICLICYLLTLSMRLWRK